MFRYTRLRLKKIIAAVSLLSLESLLIIGLLCVALLFFSFLTKEVFQQPTLWLDTRAFRFANKLVSPHNNELMKVISFLGTHKFLIPANIIVLAYFLFILRHPWYSIKVASVSLSSVTLMLVLKQIFARLRPGEPLLAPALGYSYPSGHSMVSFTFYGLLIFMSIRYARPIWLSWLISTALALLIVLIGFSRVYLRVHYASDVLAGFAVGIAWLLVSLFLLNRIERFSRRSILIDSSSKTIRTSE
jgi:undecaprenyl-diphosphatase